MVNSTDNTKGHRFREQEIAETLGELVWSPSASRRAAIAAAYGRQHPVRRYGTPEVRAAL